MSGRPFFGYLLFNTYFVSNLTNLTVRRANYVRILEEQQETDQISFPVYKGIFKSVNQKLHEVFITFCVCDF